MDSALVEQVRRFNRTVTQRIGALDEAYLARGRPLGQCRVLWEIGTAAIEVRELRSRLDLDSGYLSRLLNALQADGLVIVDTDDADGRVRRARLTPSGIVERARLDQLSDELAASILEPLDPSQRDRLVSAMSEVERLLVASMVHIDVQKPSHPDARHCVDSYFAELAVRFDSGFDPARSISADDEELTPPAGLLVVAVLHGDPIGCGALKFRGDGAAEIKRMWVAPSVRGLGLGRRILSELETRAAHRGVHMLRLETNRSLPEAIRLYRAAGYREVEPFNDEHYAHHWFEKALGPHT